MTGCCSLVVVFSFFLLLYLIRPTGVTVTSMVVYMLH